MDPKASPHLSLKGHPDQSVKQQALNCGSIPLERWLARPCPELEALGSTEASCRDGFPEPRNAEDVMADKVVNGCWACGRHGRRDTDRAFNALYVGFGDVFIR